MGMRFIKNKNTIAFVISALCIMAGLGGLLLSGNKTIEKSPAGISNHFTQPLKPVHPTVLRVDHQTALQTGQDILDNLKIAQERREKESNAGKNGAGDSSQQKAVDILLQQLGQTSTVNIDPSSHTIRKIDGDLKRIAGNSTVYADAKKRSDHAGMALALAEELGPVLRLKNPVQELTLERVSSDELGMTHIRMQQQYHGVPVWGAQISIHFDRNSDPFLLTGVYTPTPDLPVLQQEITAEAAVAVARKYGSILQSQEKDLTPPAAKRMVYWDLDRSPELCWNVDLNPDNSHALEIFVSAATGSVIHQYDKLRTEAAVGTAADLKGNTLQFPCWSEQGQYYAINTTLPMYNTITSKPPNILKLRGAMYLLDFANQDPNKSYVMNDIKTSNLTTWDPAAVSLMQNMMLIENYYRSTFNLNSLDNAGMNIWAVIHWRWVTAGGGSTSENASWNPTVRCMQFGDGEQIAAGQLPHSLDIVAHEYTHGVTNFAANLIYENQPGLWMNLFRISLLAWWTGMNGL